MRLLPLVLYGLLSVSILDAQASPVAPATAPRPSDGKPESIVVVTDDNYPPYSFKDGDGGLQGILRDQWKAWERVTGIRVDLRGMDWSEAQRVMSSGGADVIDTMFRTAEREKTLEFTGPYARVDVPVFFHEGISGIGSPEDLQGFRVAAKEGDACVEVLRSHGVTDIRLYPNYASIVEAALDGRERIFSIDLPPAIYLLTKYGMETEYRQGFTLYTGYFHRAVSRGDARMLALVNDGFARIEPSEYRAIDKRWMGIPLLRKMDSRIVIALVAIAAAAMFAAVYTLLAARVLRRRVRERTRELAVKVSELETSEAKINAMLCALPDLLFLFDRDARFLEYRTGGNAGLALTPDAFMGRTIGEVFAEPDLGNRALEAIRSTIDDGEPRTLTYVLRMPDGIHDFEARLVRLGADRALCVSRDVTEKTRMDAIIAASLREKEVLLNEIHHRVKNNLQITSSLLSMQAERIHDEFDRNMLMESQGRISAMAQVHDHLFHAQDRSSIPVKEYLADLMTELDYAWNVPGVKSRFDVAADDIKLGLDSAVPVGLIVNELATNAYKYAFSGDSGHLKLSIRRGDDGSIRLLVEDDGPGFPAGFDPSAAEGMGYTIVRALTEQLKGSLTAFNREGGGVTVEIRLPGSIGA